MKVPRARSQWLGAESPAIQEWNTEGHGRSIWRTLQMYETYHTVGKSHCSMSVGTRLWVKECLFPNWNPRGHDCQRRTMSYSKRKTVTSASSAQSQPGRDRTKTVLALIPSLACSWTGRLCITPFTQRGSAYPHVQPQLSHTTVCHQRPKRPRCWDSYRS